MEKKVPCKTRHFCYFLEKWNYFLELEVFSLTSFSFLFFSAIRRMLSSYFSIVEREAVKVMFELICLTIILLLFELFKILLSRIFVFPSWLHLYYTILLKVCQHFFKIFLLQFSYNFGGTYLPFITICSPPELLLICNF